jgi:hypothetical protein
MKGNGRQRWPTQYRTWVYIFAQKKSKIHGQIRIQIAHGVWVFVFALQEGKGRERADIPCRPAERPTKSGQGGATPLSSPLGKEAEREREEKRKGSAARREAHEKPARRAKGSSSARLPGRLAIRTQESERAGEAIRNSGWWRWRGRGGEAGRWGRSTRRPPRGIAAASSYGDRSGAARSPA